MVSCILFTHGDVGRELLRTAEAIIGKQENVVALSNEGCSRAVMENVLVETLSKDRFRDGTVIFIDLARGSCWLTVQRMRQENKKMYVISGVNLPMLLRFFNKRDTHDLPELVRNLHEAGIAGIEVGDFL